MVLVVSVYHVWRCGTTESNRCMESVSTNGHKSKSVSDSAYAAIAGTTPCNRSTLLLSDHTV